MTTPVRRSEHTATRRRPARQPFRAARGAGGAFRRSPIAASIVVVMLVVAAFNVYAFPYLNGPGFAFGEDRTRATRAGVWLIRPQAKEAVGPGGDFTNQRVREQMAFGSERIRTRMVYLHLAEVAAGRRIVTYPGSALEPVWLAALARTIPDVDDYDPQVLPSDADALAARADVTVEVEGDVYHIIVSDEAEPLRHLVRAREHFLVPTTTAPAVPGGAAR